MSPDKDVTTDAPPSNAILRVIAHKVKTAAMDNVSKQAHLSIAATKQDVPQETVVNKPTTPGVHVRPSRPVAPRVIVHKAKIVTKGRVSASSHKCTAVKSPDVQVDRPATIVRTSPDNAQVQRAK